MMTFVGLLAIGLGIYAIQLQNRIDDLKHEIERLMDCIIEIEKEMGESE